MVEFLKAVGLTDYEQAVSFMEDRVAAIRAGEAQECVWLVEHPPIYTGGTSAQDSDLLDSRFPVYQTGRGGEYTYHGPGQRVAYVMLDLKKRQAEPDIKKYVWQLEEWIIRTLAAFDITGERRAGRVGIWVCSPPYPPAGGGGEGSLETSGGEKKIAAIGVRVRHWVTYHGIAINVAPDLSHFKGIVPCGISEHGVTSFADLGLETDMEKLDTVLKQQFTAVFP